MGLIVKELSAEQLNINNNYKARYVELAKPMGGAIALVIYGLLGGSDASELKIKLSSILATFICWILGEQIIDRFCVYFNLYTTPNAKNPLYRTVKTLASLGSSLGIIVASLRSSLADRKLSISLHSMLMGSVVGLLAFIIRRWASDDSSLPDETLFLAQLGTEGWSKYAKTALVVGGSVGQFIGGLISYAQHSDAVSCIRNITLYNAIASVVGFFAALLFVPLINYLNKGILITKDRDIFNNNYVRSGLSLGVAIGTILAGLFGPLISTALSAEVAIALGASACSIICAIGLGFYGQKLSIYFERFWGVSRNTENSWSYAARSTSYFFSYIGIVATFALCPAATFMTSLVIGSAIASLIGWFAGLFIICLARKIEPDEAMVNATTLPWTQRISSGTTKGAVIGALAGIALSFLTGVPLGLVECCVLVSALGGILGGIISIASDSVFYELIDKATSLLADVIDPIMNYLPSFNMTQRINRFSFFANSASNLSGSPAANSSPGI